MRAILWACLGILLIAIPSTSAEIYIPGPERDTMMEQNGTYEYKLPDWMDSVCLNTLACNYHTVTNRDIVHTYYGLNQGGTMELTVIQGDAQTYNITVSSLDIEPEELTITTGSTLIFHVVEGETKANIVLPWNPDKPEETVETPGFGVDLICIALLLAFALRRNRYQ
ncbi:MAG: hypothetical protein CMB72_02705 [Euryarchaeota archaeon]|nr:hypothetical protein [Euryarchaeota archaeon]